MPNFKNSVAISSIYYYSRHSLIQTHRLLGFISLQRKIMITNAKNTSVNPVFP